MTTASTPQPTVYIVDDDLATRKSLRWLVETLGVPVQTFHCAVSFLDAYDPSMPGCLVLDMMMPGMSGLELQKELLDRGIDIPVIVLTGYADVSTAVRTLKNGAVEFLEKPFNDDVLLEQIRKALALDTLRRSRARRARSRLRTDGPPDAARTRDSRSRRRGTFEQRDRQPPHGQLQDG